MKLWSLAVVLAQLYLLPANGFIFTYDLPAEFTDGIAQMPINRSENPWTHWYDVDQVLYPVLQSHSVANPDAADLFYIPIFTAQLYHSLLLTAEKGHAGSMNETATMVSRALQWVKTEFPYWNRTNGLDHFLVMPLDHGRCSSMAGLDREAFGDSFTIQLSGDILLQDFETRSWNCYRPGRDILIPSMTEEDFTVDNATLPNATSRDISVLYRFVGGGRGDYGLLRSQVLKDQRDNPIQGSLAGWQTVAGTHEDMRRSVFCVCPPGIAQQTLRMWRSIMSGCIPVTFFKAHDQPYERNLNLDYTKFSININPQEHHLLAPILTGILNNPAKLRQMQAELTKVQQMFIWDKVQKKGVFDMILSELSQHTARSAASL